jgi:hypothetical protein
LAVLGASATAAAIGLALLFSEGRDRAEAHGIVDQSQTTTTTVAFNNSVPMAQEFVPAANTLVAIDIKGTAPFGDEPDLVWTVLIRKDYFVGPVIALKTMVGLSGTETVYHVDFGTPIALTPGETYVIEVGAEKNYFQWSVALSGDPYPAGDPDSVLAAAYPDGDRYFVTYSAPPVTPSPTPRPTRTPAPR